MYDEEAKYEAWVMSGGRARAENKAAIAALEALMKMESEGFEVLRREMKVHSSTDEYATLHAVVYRDGLAHVIYWRHGRFWHSPEGCGSVWFK